MLSLLFTFVEWTIKLMILMVVVAARAISAAYRVTESAIHAHRVTKDPAADRSQSQVMAGAVVAAGIGVLVLLGSLTGGGGTPAQGPAAERAATTGGAATLASIRATPTPDAAKLERAQAEQRARKQRARKRAAAAAAARKRATAAAAARTRAAAAAAARKRAAAAKRRARQRAAALAAAAATPPPAPAPNCDPNYKGACLDPNASDYDCAGGSGNGPEYTGEVTVVGSDHYDLDRDGDGLACE